MGPLRGVGDRVIGVLEATEAQDTSCFVAAKGKVIQGLNSDCVELGPTRPQTELFLIEGDFFPNAQLCSWTAEKCLNN